jgi:hypothetical protein
VRLKVPFRCWCTTTWQPANVARQRTRWICKLRFCKLTVLSRFTLRSNCSEKIRSKSRFRQGTKALPPLRGRDLKTALELGDVIFP